MSAVENLNTLGNMPSALSRQAASFINDPALLSHLKTVPHGCTKSIGAMLASDLLGVDVDDETLEAYIKEFGSQLAATSIAKAAREDNIATIISAVSDRYPDCVVNVEVDFSEFDDNDLLEASLAASSGNVEKALDLLDICKEVDGKEVDSNFRPLDHTLRQQDGDGSNEG